MRIVYVGDIHGNFNALHRLIKISNGDVVITVGDFGFWRAKLMGFNDHQYIHQYFDRFPVPVYFCDGNHEDHDQLTQLVAAHGNAGPIDVGNNVFYMPRGSTLNLGGLNHMFIGGAYSIDRHARLEHVTWFEQEQLSSRDLVNIDLNQHIDVIISHTCPLRTLKTVCDSVNIDIGNVTVKSTEKLLDQVFDIYTPRRWVFGHWHGHCQFELDRCQFTLLDMIRQDNDTWFDVVEL